MLDTFTREGVLTPYPGVSQDDISSLEYNPDRAEFVTMSNSPGGVGATYGVEIGSKLRDYSISINNADSEDLTHISGDMFAYCSEDNVVEEFDVVTGNRFGKYTLPPATVSNKGFECLAYNKLTGDYWVAQEGSPMILYVFPKDTSNSKRRYDLTSSGYTIPFDLDVALSAHTDHVAGMCFNSDGNILFICEYNGTGKIIEVSTSGQVIDTFTDLPILGGPAGGYEAITVDESGNIWVGSEPSHYLKLTQGVVVEPKTSCIEEERSNIKGTQSNGKITVQHQFVDILGNTITFPSKHVDPSFDIEVDRAKRKERLEVVLKDKEVHRYLSEIERGNDPFTSDPSYQSRDELLQSVLVYILSLPRVESVKYSSFLTRMASMSDSKINSLLNVDPTTVREWETDIQSISTINNKTEVL